MKLKYIYFRDTVGFPFTIIFGDNKSHDDIARKLNVTGKVLSAGFIYIDDYGIARVYGESISLKIKANATKYEKEVNLGLGLSSIDYEEEK